MFENDEIHSYYSIGYWTMLVMNVYYHVINSSKCSIPRCAEIHHFKPSLILDVCYVATTVSADS